MRFSLLLLFAAAAGLAVMFATGRGPQCSSTEVERAVTDRRSIDAELAKAEVALLEMAATEPDNAAIQRAAQRGIMQLKMIGLDYKSAMREGIPDSTRDKRIVLQFEALMRDFENDLRDAGYQLQDAPEAD